MTWFHDTAELNLIVFFLQTKTVKFSIKIVNLFSTCHETKTLVLRTTCLLGRCFVHLHIFLANVNVSSRPSVYRLSSHLSVTFVCPTQAIEIFGNVSTPFGTMAVC